MIAAQQTMLRAVVRLIAKDDVVRSVVIINAPIRPSVVVADNQIAKAVHTLQLRIVLPNVQIRSAKYGLFSLDEHVFCTLDNDSQEAFVGQDLGLKAADLVCLVGELA